MPQLFAGVQSVHVSLSMLKRVRGKFNVAVHSAKTAASHFLSPIFTAKDDYEPFLYIFRTRLSALRATILSFQVDAAEHWNSLQEVDLVNNQTKILGPLTCFIWGCQVLGWKLEPNFVVVTLAGRRLHLLLSPLEEWHDLLVQDWITYAWRKCSWKPDWINLHVCVHDWRAVWSIAKTLPYFTCKFRVFGLLSGTAKAHINHLEHPKCELCGSEEAGQRHLALNCPKTLELRQLPKFRVLPRIHPFTICTGIPCRTEAWMPLQVPQPVRSRNFLHRWISESTRVSRGKSFYMVGCSCAA